MEKKRKDQVRRGIGWALAAGVIGLSLSPGFQGVSNVPDVIRLSMGQQAELQLPREISVSLRDEGGVLALSSMDEELSGGYIVTGEAAGDSALVLSAFGLPVRTVPVSVREQRVITPGGQSIGVALRVGGALVVGLSDLKDGRNPAREAGLKPGDLITAVDGKKFADAAALSDSLTGAEQILTVSREGADRLIPITALVDSRGDALRLGAWVRDSTAGVGTLSFYDPDSGAFAALGHPITDSDTGSVMPVGEGYIYESRIVGLARGAMGEPGELKGEFFSGEKLIGQLTENGQLGIYGESDEPLRSELYPRGVPVMARDQVRTGPAQIITTIGSNGTRAYDCEITRLYHQDEPSPRSMVVRITDPELIEETGGIVQGMSGSPIIQNGQLAGAVTHVFINDPTQGYGLYAEWMIDEALSA